MKTDALIEMRNHAEANLWPFPDRMQHLDTSEFDFNTEVSMFETNLAIVFRELKDNIIECPKEDAQKYAGHAIEILQEAREQVNQFFTSDIDYNKKLQQIEAEGVSEEPDLGLTPADSISADKLEFPVDAIALYLNKICIWGLNILQTRFSDGTQKLDEGIFVPGMAASSKGRLLLLKHTGLYKYFLEKYQGKTQKKLAETIGALIGSGTANVIKSLSLIDQPLKSDKNSPYSEDAILFSIAQLEKMGEDVSELREIYFKKFKNEK